MVNLNNPHLYVKGTYEAKFFDIATNDLTYYSNKLQTDNIKSSINLGAINAGIGNPAVIQIPDTPQPDPGDDGRRLLSGGAGASGGH